jgi:hypothetical protein
MTGKMVHDAERDVDIDTLADRHLELSGDFTEVLDAAIDDREDMGRDEILRVVMEAAATVLFRRGFSRDDLIAELTDPWWHRQ